jgi:hypothetical protein
MDRDRDARLHPARREGGRRQLQSSFPLESRERLFEAATCLLIKLKADGKD